jgi:hypothetical protein
MIRWALATFALAAVPLHAVGADRRAAEAVARRATEAASHGRWGEALKGFREAYLIDGSPRWLYNMAVLYDRSKKCLRAAFFYRAAERAGGVLPADAGAVRRRLAALAAKCDYEKREKQAAYRRKFGALFLRQGLCGFAEQLLGEGAARTDRRRIRRCAERLQSRPRRVRLSRPPP